MNSQKRESPTVEGSGISKSVHIETANRKKNIRKNKPPTKAEVSIDAFLRCGSLNTFEANREYNDTCLHSCVSHLQTKFGLEFDRKFEDVGAKRPVKRYTPRDIDKMKRTLYNLRVARGAGNQL